MKKLILLFLFSNSILFAKQPATESKVDMRAKKILDELSAKTKTYKSIISDFIISVDNKANKTKDTQKGKIWIKGLKFKLDMANQIVINDSKNVYTILKDAEEVQINLADDKKSEDKINPSNIFTLYEKGFKYEYIKEEKSKDGKSDAYLIKLYPNEPKKRNFHTLQLRINKQKKQVESIVIFGKDGTNTTYTIKTFDTISNVSDDIFAFSEKQFPKFEVIDLR